MDVTQSPVLHDVFMSNIIPKLDPFQRLRLSYTCRQWRDLVSKTWNTVHSIALDAADLEAAAVLKHAGNYITKLHLVIPESVHKEVQLLAVYGALADYCSDTLIQLIIDCRLIYKFDLLPEYLHKLEKLEHIHWIFRGREGQQHDSNMYEWDIADYITEISVKLPSLRCFFYESLMDKPLFTDAGFNKDSTGLEAVSVRNVNCNKFVLTRILADEDPSKLKVLRLPECDLDAGELAQFFSKARKLEVLDLSSCKYYGSADEEMMADIVTVIGTLEHLTEINISHNSELVPCEQIGNLLSLGPSAHNLTVLNLCHAGITDSFGTVLMRLTNLKLLDLSDNSLNDWSLIPCISRLTKLETLFLCHCTSLKGNFMGTIATCAQLKHIGLVGCKQIMNSALEPLISQLSSAEERRSVTLDVLDTGVNLAHMFADATWHNLPLILNFENCDNSGHKHKTQIAPLSCPLHHNIK